MNIIGSSPIEAETQIKQQLADCTQHVAMLGHLDFPCFRCIQMTMAEKSPMTRTMSAAPGVVGLYTIHDHACTIQLTVSPYVSYIGCRL